MTHSFPTRRSSDLGGLIPSASSRFDLRRIDSPSAFYYETITSVRFHDFTIPHPRRTAGGSELFREPDMTLYSIYQRDPILVHMKLENGRAASRERVCRYVKISAFAGLYK